MARGGSGMSLEFRSGVDDDLGEIFCDSILVGPDEMSGFDVLDMRLCLGDIVGLTAQTCWG